MAQKESLNTGAAEQPQLALSPRQQGQELLKVDRLSGSELLRRVLDQPHPRPFVEALSQQDFYWLIKRVGEEDCLPLLELATTGQWQYVLDLELWHADRLSLPGTITWLARLHQADPRRLARWLFSEGQHLAFLALFKSVEVVLKGHDEDKEISEEFFTLDGVFHVRAKDRVHRKEVEALLRSMAKEDFVRYQALLLSLAGVLPAEMEEELYRLRNVRLAEHGFLPWEEAVAVYAPLPLEKLKKNQSPESTAQGLPEDIRALVPLSPFEHAGQQLLVRRAAAHIRDPELLDRIRLEFAGLCNQIISAEKEPAVDLDLLIRVSRKAGGYVNLALEAACAKDEQRALHLLQERHLVELFRIGFGVALALKWEAERWLLQSWFRERGFDWSFWGEEWGAILDGICRKRPLFYTGSTGPQAYRGFERVDELQAARTAVYQVMALDATLRRLASTAALPAGLSGSPEFDFRPLLFNYWARRLMGLSPGFEALTLEQVRALFLRLREGDKAPPYRMRPGRKALTTFYTDLAPDALKDRPELLAALEQAISAQWTAFEEEYTWVEVEDLDRRFLRFLWVA